MLAVPLGALAQGSTWQTATPLNNGGTGTGSLDGNSQDAWFKIEVPEEGRVVLTETPGGTLSVQYVDICRPTAEGDVTSRSSIWPYENAGTLDVTDAGKGTYYIHVHRYSGAGSFTLSYQFTACPRSNDAEPNDNGGQGALLENGKTVEGRMGYLDATDYRDGDDWYKIEVPSDGIVKLTYTPDTDFGLSMQHIDFCWLNNEGSYVSRTSIWPYDNKGELIVTDAGVGTYYIRLHRYSGHGGYQLRYDFTPQRYGNDSEPNDNFIQGEEITIGQTIQGHMGYLDATDYRDRDDWYKIVVPQDGTVKLAFSPNQEFDLSMQYIDFCWLNTEGSAVSRRSIWPYNNTDTLTVADAGVGTYYVRLHRYSGHGGYTLKYIFQPNNYRNDGEPNNELEQATPLEVNSNITAHLGYLDANDQRDGDDWFKLETDNAAMFIGVEYARDTTTTLSVQYIDIVKKKGDQTQAVTTIWPYETATGQLTVNDIDEAAEYYVHVHRYSGNGGYSLTYGALERMETSMVRVTFSGQNSVRLGIPCEYTIKVENIDNHHSGKWFLLVNATDDIKLLGAKLPCNSGVEELPMDSITYEGDQSMVFVVPSMAPYESYTFNILAEGLVIKEAPAFNDQVEFDTNYSGHGPNRFVISGTTALCVVGLVVLDYAGDKVTEFMTDVINEHIDLDEKELAYYRTRVNNKVDQQLATYKKETGEGVVVAKRAVKTVATKWIETIPGGGLINFFGELIETTKTFSGAITRRWLYWTQRDLDPNYKEWEKQYDAKMLDAKMGCNRIVRSWDPNEMVGPVGYGDNNYIAETRTMDYRILFENKKEATAPAYRIRITDVLDEQVFDVSSVRFGQTSHDGDAYNWKMSREGNKLSWDIEGIELPPNVNAPEGEGYVTFSVDLLPGLKSGTQLKNKATIIFDYNEPIETNEYVNTLDFTAPTGKVAASAVSGNNMVLNLEGHDTESGVSHYLVYYSTDGQDFHFCDQSMTGSITIPVETGHSAADYTFAVVAVDNVGNAQLTLSEPWSMAAGISTPVADMQAWTIATLGGTVVASGPNGTPSARLVPGVYVIRQGGQSRKIIVK